MPGLLPGLFFALVALRKVLELIVLGVLLLERMPILLHFHGHISCQDETKQYRHSFMPIDLRHGGRSDSDPATQRIGTVRLVKFLRPFQEQHDGLRTAMP